MGVESGFLYNHIFEKPQPPQHADSGIQIKAGPNAQKLPDMPSKPGFQTQCSTGLL